MVAPYRWPLPRGLSCRDAVMYRRELDKEQATPSLFDLLDLEGGKAA